MSDTIISVEGLGKKYVLSHQGGGERGYARFSERLQEALDAKHKIMRQIEESSGQMPVVS